MKLRFISDPGHAWLEVPHAVINDLGIADRISGYPYSSKANAYLEEDCDAALFFEAAKDADMNLEIQDVYEEFTNIRNMSSYKGGS